MKRYVSNAAALICAAAVMLSACSTSEPAKEAQESTSDTSFSHTSATPADTAADTAAGATDSTTAPAAEDTSAAETGGIGDVDLFGFNAKNDPEKMWDILPYIDYTPVGELTYVIIDAQDYSFGMQPYDFGDSEKAVIVNGYKGSADAVRIPDKIDGFPVVAVSFYGSDYDGVQDYGLKELIVPDTVKRIDINKETIEYMNIPDGAYVCMPEVWMNNTTSEFGALKGLYLDADYFGSVLVDDCPDISVMRKGRIFTHDNIAAMDDTFVPYRIMTEVINDYEYNEETNENVLVGKTTKYHLRDCLDIAESITIPDGVTDIYTRAFSGCTKLKSVEIPDSVESVEGAAFSGCTSLKSIVIPDSVTFLGGQEMYDLTGAFYGCTSLTDVTIGKGLEKTINEAFQGCPVKTLRLRGENNLSFIFDDSQYHNINLTEMFPEIEILVIEDGVQTLTATMVPKVESLKRVVLPDTLKTIDSNAFSGCSGLVGIKIPGSVEKIGDFAFGNCINLTGIVIPDSVTELGLRTFGNCTSLKDVTIGMRVTQLPPGMFFGCTSLESIVIPNGVTEIGSASGRFEDVTGGVFANCEKLKKVELPESLKSIGCLTFANCTSLDFIRLPDSITYLGGYGYVAYYLSIEEREMSGHMGALGPISCFYRFETEFNKDLVVSHKNKEYKGDDIFEFEKKFLPPMPEEY